VFIFESGWVAKLSSHDALFTSLSCAGSMNLGCPDDRRRAAVEGGEKIIGRKTTARENYSSSKRKGFVFSDSVKDVSQSLEEPEVRLPVDAGPSLLLRERRGVFAGSNEKPGASKSRTRNEVL